MEGSAEQQAEKVYPGGIKRYNEAREARLSIHPSDPSYVGLCVTGRGY